MNSQKALTHIGSGCCLVLPYVGLPLVDLAASAAEPMAVTEVPFPSTETSNQPQNNELSYSVSTDDEWLLEPVTSQPIASSVPIAPLPITPETADFDVADHIDFGVESTTTEAVAPSVAVDLSVAVGSPVAMDSSAASAAIDPAALGTLMVELRVAGSSSSVPISVPSLVKGAEDGRQAIAFDQWLIPFDDVNQLLGFTAAIQADGQLSLRSSEIVTQVQLESLPTDSDLGVMWSIADISEYLGATAEFDLASYSIQFNQDSLRTSAAVQPISAQADAIYASANTYLKASQVANAVPAETAAEVLPLPLHSPIEVSRLSDEVADEVSVEVLPLAAQQATNPVLGLLLVGLAIDEITTVEATLIRGGENGEGAIAFSQWLIPFEDAITALGGHVTRSEDGLLAIRTPTLATMLDPQDLQSDPDLGTVISIAEIEKALGVTAEFDRGQYAVKFSPSIIEHSAPRQRMEGPSDPVIMAGLPAVTPDAFSLSAVSQATRMNSSPGRFFNTPIGELSAIGSAFKGAWYARVDQPELDAPDSWQLRELQYLRQGDRNDYVLGTQPTFWRSRNTNQDYWGATTVQRWGFTPANSDYGGGFNPRERMQSSEIGRTVSGEAAPGTFVQLTQGLNGFVIDETIVNSSGIYRFENVPASGQQLSNQYSDSGYLVQLYANGQLTRQPEIRSAAFTTLPGQLPGGASALITSLGVGHQVQSDPLMGDFDALKAGMAYRRGLSESLTMGAGLVQDGSTQLLAEAFYLPEQMPLQASFAAIVALETGDTQVDANVRYQPTENLSMTFDSDRFSQRLDASWKLSPNFSLIAAGNTRDHALSLGARVAYQLQGWRGSLNAAIDTRQHLSWGLYTTNGAFNLSSQGNEIFTYSSMTYRLPGRSRGLEMDGSGHELALTYETFRASELPFKTVADGMVMGSLGTGQLMSVEWRYRSRSRAFDGQSRWNFAVGYGMSAHGSGPIVSAAAAIGQGLDLQMRYQSVSAFDETDSFQLSMVSRFGTQNGLGWGNRRQDKLRNQGGLRLQPFFDTNANGVRESEEPLYLDSPELLMLVNHKAVNAYQSDVQSDGVSMVLPPGTYRLDIDPAGLPLDRNAAEMAYAMEVVAGQYTTVAVPLVLTYSVSGVVSDRAGVAVAGARVEAVSDRGHRQISVTNGAGVYYLERLQPEAYELTVNGVLIQDSPLFLEGETEAFQEREIHLL